MVVIVEVDQFTSQLFTTNKPQESSRNSSLKIWDSVSQNVTTGIYYEETLVWQSVMDGVAMVLTVVGILANLATLFTLVFNGRQFSRAILTLLRHQSFADAVACIMAMVLIMQPYMWTSGYYVLDLFICHAWHSQQFYWGVIYTSIWNLVLLSFERYLAVCQPFKHQNLNPRKLYVTIVTIYISSVIFTGGSFFQAHFRYGVCVAEYYFEGKFADQFFSWFSIFTFFIVYLFPCMLFFMFYGLVILEFRKRQQSDMASSRIIDKATTELTKTAIVVTLIFIITMGFDNWYYVLGNTGVTKYLVNSPIQKVSMALAGINSAANPFVYVMLMPSYRRSIIQTYSCRIPNQRASSQQSVNTVSSSVY